MKIIDCIFCDDIRFELQHKVSLMGIYSDRMVFTVTEDAVINGAISTKLSLFLRIKMEDQMLLPERFKFEYFLNSQSLICIEQSIQANKESSFINLALVIPNLMLNVGGLGFVVKLFAKDRRLFIHENMNALKIEINKVENLLGNVPEVS